MSGYDGEGTIPRGGPRESFRRYVCRVYGSPSLLQFFGYGLILTLFSSFPTVLGCRLRGWIYRCLFGGMGKECFLEKNIRLFNFGRVFLGERVFIGENVFFDIGPKADSIRIGDDSHISRGVTVRTQKGAIRIGEKVNIGSGSFLYGYGDIEIGDFCLLANHVELITGDHRGDNLDQPMRFQGRDANRISLKEDVWVGVRAIILGGVTIGRGAIIGAGAVVTRDIPEYAVAVGVPARVIRIRGL